MSRTTVRLGAAFGALLLLAVMANPTMATHGRPDHGVPFSFTGITTDGYGPPTCPGAAWQFFSSGWVQATHLGRAASEVSHCTWLDSPTTGHFGPGTVSLTAANGDSLVLIHRGTFQTVLTPDHFLSLIELTWEVSGGTGRFANATGGGSGHVVGDIWAGTSTVSYRGTIAYDASNGSGT